MIKPSIGRIVWFYSSLEDSKHPAFQPRPATIDYVHSDSLVDLTVFRGGASGRGSVPLIQEGEQAPTTGYYATWMPYQIQAVKPVEPPKA